MPVKLSDVKVGDSKTMVVFDDLTRTQIVMYAGASGDYNPLHSDELFTTKIAGYPTVFAHGMLSMGATGRVLTDWFGADGLTKYGVRFVNQVWPGDTLTATATVEAIREEDGQHLVDLTVTTTNQDGNPVDTGTATARVDGL
jgi:acyl dehydratase